MDKPILLNEITIPVRWVDIDAYNHVNNSHYFDAMTEARAQYILPLSHLAPDCQFILVDTQCNFKKPYYYPGYIRLQQFLNKIGNSSFELNYLFLNDESDAIHAEGHAKIVCFSAMKKKVIRVPDGFREKIINQSSKT